MKIYEFTDALDRRERYVVTLEHTVRLLAGELQLVVTEWCNTKHSGVEQQLGRAWQAKIDRAREVLQQNPEAMQGPQ